ncbi:MAG: hypothetical protein ABW131_09690 [Candidatus Sedimenticola sp. 6PFRAG5]
MGSDATVTAASGISLSARHNMDATGNKMAGMGAFSTVNEAGGGLVDVGVMIIKADAIANVSSWIGADTTITTTSGGVSLDSFNYNYADTNANRYTGGAVNVGVLIAEANAGDVSDDTDAANDTGVTSAYITGNSTGGTATIGGGGDLSIDAKGIYGADSTTNAAGGAIVGVNVSVPSATVDPTIRSYIGSNANVNMGGAANLSALSEGDATVTANGAGGAAVAVNVVDVKAEISTDVDAYVGSGATVTAGTGINLDARHNMYASGSKMSGKDAVSTVNEAGGGLVNVGVMVVKADAIANVSSWIGANTTMTTTAGGVSLDSLNYNYADANANRYSGGAVNVGVLIAEANAGDVSDDANSANDTGVTSAYITGNSAGGTATISGGGDLVIDAKGIYKADAYTKAYGGAIVGVNVIVPTATVDPTIRSYIGNNARVNMGGSAELYTSSEGHASNVVRGAGGAAVDVGVVDVKAAVTPNITTNIGDAVVTASQDVVISSRHNYDANGQQISANMAKSDVIAAGGGLAKVDVLLANAVASAKVNSLVNTGAEITATNGSVTIESLSANIANAASSRDSGGGINVGVLISDATTNRSATDKAVTNAALYGRDAGGNGILSAGGDLIIRSTSNNVATSTTSANGGAIVGVNVNTPEAVVNPYINASINDNALVDVRGSVSLSTISDNRASNTVTGAGGAAIDVGVVTIKAESTPDVDSRIGKYADVTGDQGISLNSTVSSNTAYTRVKTAGGAGINVDVIKATSKATADVHAFVDNNAELTSNGNISLQALSGASSTSDTDVVSGGGVSADILESIATISGTTAAHINNSAVIHNANTVELRSESTNTASSDAYVGSGAGVAVRGTKATTTVTPNTYAYIGYNATLNADGDVTIDATSLRSEGNATATSIGGGGVDVGSALAKVTTNPTVKGYVQSGTTITAGGDVRITATADSQGNIPNLPDTIGGVNTGSDTVTFDSHGMISGDIVYYSKEGGSLNTASGALADGRELLVLKVNDNTLQFGAAFDGADVDSARDIITFRAPHLLQTGDAVKYTAGSGGSISSGLNSTSTYYVRALDEFTIKLFNSKAAAQQTLTGFNTSNVSSNTITITNHGFSNGDAVTYSAPSVVGFDSTLVDVVVDASGNKTETNNNRIYVGQSGHSFNSGDRVTYQADGTVIDGLVSGETYFVIAIPGDDSYIQLASSYYRAVGHDPDPNTAGDEIPITPISLTPDKDTDSGATKVNHKLVPPSFGSLQDGVTYYVANVSGNSFQLANSAGAVLSLSKSGRYGTHEIGYAGINLSASSGTNNLRLDLTSWSQGGKLLGSGGVSLRLLSPPPGDGESYAKAQGGAGGFIEVGVPTAKLYATYNVNAFTAANLIDAGGDVDINTSSTGKFKSYAKNAAGGFIKVGETRAFTSFNNTSKSEVRGNAQVLADGAFTMSSDFVLASNDVDSIAHGGGFLAFAKADADAYITNNSLVVVGQNANISARSVLLDAKVSKIRADAYGESKAGGLTGTSNAYGHVTTNSYAKVEMQGTASTNTVIEGFEGVDIKANQSDIYTNGHKYSVFYGISIPGGSSGESGTRTSTVVANDGVTVKAGTSGNADATALYVYAASSITWNADVVLGGGSNPELVIDEDGNIEKAHNISATVGADSITVNNLTNDDPRNVEFRSAFISGSGGTWDFHNSFDSVTILNKSDKQLNINSIDVINSTVQPEVRLISPVESWVTLQFDITQSVSPSLFDIRNRGASDIIIHGVIENPIGEVRILNEQGDILSIGTQAIVRANILDMDATLGSIGQPGNRLKFEIVRSSGLAEHLFADAGQDIYLDLRGRLRVPGVTGFDINVDSVRAGGDADLLLQAGVRETTLAGSGTASKIRVITPATSGYYANHFRPDTGTSPALNLGVFADMNNAQEIESTYVFGLMETGGNISVSAADPGPAAGRINITGSTNTLGTGHIDINTNGRIILTEILGDMRVGNIQSQDDDVTLSATGSIIDAEDDPAADVSGNRLNLVSLSSIGAPLNELDIDSQLLTAVSGNDIYLNEVSGNLNLNTATAPGHVHLHADGSILDANNNSSSNINAASIELESRTGTIGTSANDLDVDTLSAGLITARAAQSIYLIEAVGSMSVLNANSTSGDIRLRTPDNFMLVTGGSITAAGNVSITGDYNDSDIGTGTVIDIMGTLTADSVNINGGSDDDLIGIINLVAQSPSLVDGGLGNDIIYLGSSVSGSPDDGLLEGIDAPLLVDGNDHGIGDRLVIDDTADTLDNTGWITASTVSGFGLGTPVTYLHIENLDVELGTANDTATLLNTAFGVTTRIMGNDGDDTINVHSTTAGSDTFVTGNAGDDNLNVSSDAPVNAGTVNNIEGDIYIYDGIGDNHMVVSDLGETAPSTVTITEHAISGLSPVDIRYSGEGDSFSGTVEVISGSGDDTFDILSLSGEATTIVRTNQGDDRVTVHATVTKGAFEAYGGTGDDYLDALDSGIPVRFSGDDGSDILLGSVHDDQLSGGRGTDYIIGDFGRIETNSPVVSEMWNTAPEPGGNDLILGGDGMDFLIGAGGNDFIMGGAGQDIIFGDSGRILFNNGFPYLARSIFLGQGGMDVLVGGRGSDIMIGGADFDGLFGNFSEDLLIGGEGYVELLRRGDNFIVKRVFSINDDHSPAFSQLYGITAFRVGAYGLGSEPGLFTFYGEDGTFEDMIQFTGAAITSHDVAMIEAFDVNVLPPTAAGIDDLECIPADLYGIPEFMEQLTPEQAELPVCEGEIQAPGAGEECIPTEMYNNPEFMQQLSPEDSDLPMCTPDSQDPSDNGADDPADNGKRNMLDEDGDLLAVVAALGGWKIGQVGSDSGSIMTRRSRIDKSGKKRIMRWDEELVTLVDDEADLEETPWHTGYKKLH